MKILTVFFLFLFSISLNAQEQVYEFRTYELEVFRPAEVLHNYFAQALIPALNRQGIENIGVFEESGESLPAKIYLLIPYTNIQAFMDSKDLLDQDKLYLQAAGSYFDASQEVIPYQDYTSNLIRSAEGFPKLIKPSEESDLFELRIYGSHNEDALRRKIQMFNDSEFGIFEYVGLPVVFFGANIAGSNMPCLTYLLAFKDKQAHEEAWSKFGPHPEWQRITQMEEYADAMNDIRRVFLKRIPYSQL